MALDESQNKDDIMIESEGIKVVYNSGIQEHIKDLEIDYADSMYEKGFVIRGSGLSSC